MSITSTIKGFCLFTMLVLGQLAVAQDTSDLINLSLDDLLNMEVTTASKSAEKLSDAAGVLTVVTKDELNRFGGTTLKDILARVPSLNASTAYFTDRSIMSARGAQVKLTSAHILLLINGRPVREVVEGGIDSEIYETFPVNIIERIEVIKGPGSVLYGTNAFSAVINIITEKADKNGASVTAVAGENGAFGTSASVTLKKDDLSIVAAGRFYELAEMETVYKKAQSDNSVSSANITIPNKGPGAYLGVNYKNFRFMSTFNEWENIYFSSLNTGVSKWTKNFNDFGYNVKINEKWNMDLNFTYTQAKLVAQDYPNIERNSTDMVAEWTNYVQATDKFRVIFGGLVNFTEGKEDFFGLGFGIEIANESRKSYGLYSQVDYQVISNLKLIGGFQANKVKNLDADVVPRAGAIWYPHARINIKALYSQAFRAPSVDELGLNHPALRGNPDLTPEKVGTLDLGISYLGDQTQFGINYFKSSLSDIIATDRSVVPGIYVNYGEIEIQGVEIEGKYYINQAVYLTGSMLYQKSKDKEADEENVTPQPNLGVKAGISYMAANGITISLFNNYLGELDERFDPTLNPKTEAVNLLSLYGKLNLNKLLDLNMQQQVSVFIQADNLLNKELWLPDWGGVKGETIPINPGRAIYLGINAAL